MTVNPIKIILCRVGERPVLDALPGGDSARQLRMMQALVGGYVERVPLVGVLAVYENEDAIALDLPFNRTIVNAARTQTRIRGDFVIVGESYRTASLVDVSDADFEFYRNAWSTTNETASAAMRAARRAVGHSIVM